MTFQLDSTSRQAERDRIAAQAEKRATEAARASYDEFALVGRSLKCGGAARWTGDSKRLPWHRDEEGGCTNDGGSCICECHDQPSSSVPTRHTQED